MPRTLLDLDSPSSWPAELRTYLDKHHDLFVEWETKKQAQVSAQLQRSPPQHRYRRPALSAQSPDKAKVFSQAYDRAIYGLRDILQAYEILGWHCTRLTDAEVDEILRDGMELPNAKMLTRRIDALVKANVIDPDVGRRLKSENRAGEECCAEMVWFCFSPPGNFGEYGIGRFFRHWGGEALYVCHEDDRVTSPVLRRIGTPRLVEADVPIASLRPHGNLETIVYRRFLISRGYCTKESTDYEDYILNPLSAENVRRVISFPDPDFYSLTNCDEWKEYALELTEHSG